jgi:ATP-dependent Lon protease
VVLPARNGPDLDDVPQEVRDALTFHLAERVEDVLGVALGWCLAGAGLDSSASAGGPGLAEVA